MKRSLPIAIVIVIASQLALWRPMMADVGAGYYYILSLAPSILAILLGIAVFQLGKRIAGVRSPMTGWKRAMLGVMAFVTASLVGAIVAYHMYARYIHALDAATSGGQQTDHGGGPVALAIVVVHGLIAGIVGCMFGAGLGQSTDETRR